jgi:hypothetical protein
MRVAVLPVSRDGLHDFPYRRPRPRTPSAAMIAKFVGALLCSAAAEAFAERFSGKQLPVTERRRCRASAQSSAWRGAQRKKRRRIVGIGAGGA